MIAGGLKGLTTRAVIRRAAALGVIALDGESMESLGDRLHALRPSTPRTRSLACDAWLLSEGRAEVVAYALAGSECGGDLGAWLFAECKAQGVKPVAWARGVLW